MWSRFDSLLESLSSSEPVGQSPRSRFHKQEVSEDIDISGRALKKLFISTSLSKGFEHKSVVINYLMSDLFSNQGQRPLVEGWSNYGLHNLREDFGLKMFYCSNNKFCSFIIIFFLQFVFML